jgi:hypothetical protein
MTAWMTGRPGRDPAPPQASGLRAWRRSWRSRATPDPFDALRVQSSLARLEREMDRLRGDDEGFAVAHHLRAAMLAYDDLLGEARRLAGMDEEPSRGGSAGRLLTVAELHARGWDW